MEVSKNEKSQILKAYFDKSITKQEMETLLLHGIVMSPISWIFATEAEQLKDKQRRQLICRIFGLTDTEIKWVDGRHNNQLTTD
jgi:hypothetical protein